MQDIPQEQINKRFQLLPESLQDAIFSEQTADAVRKTCVLREAEEYMSPVAMLAGHVLLGYLRPELFAQEIQKETGMEELKAQHVAHDLDMEVFSEVRLELKKLYPPTMQTPTVQSWTAQRSPQSDLPTTHYSPPTKPKYVIAIPERFQNKSFPGMPAQPVAPEIKPAPAVVPAPTAAAPLKQEPVAPSAGSGQAAPVAPAIPSATPEQIKPVPAVVPPQSTPEAQAKPEPVAAPLKANEANAAKEASPGKTAQTVEPSGIKINPVVPLPTFIGSRFKAGEDAEKQAPSAGSASSGQADASKRIKDAIAKFSASNTAKQKTPGESPYRERI